MSSSLKVLVPRDSVEADIPAIQAIYAHHVANGLASFEEIPPDAAELAQRRRAILDKGLPYIAVDIDGKLAGYAYAGPFRPRSAYRFSVEDSIYVAPGLAGRGLGRALLSALIERTTAWGARQMIAVIGDSANAGSIACMPASVSAWWGRSVRSGSSTRAGSTA